MKYPFLPLLIPFAIACACTNYKEKETPVSFGVNVNELSYNTESSVCSVVVSSGTKWDVASMPSWIALQSISSFRGTPYEWLANFSAEVNNGYNREGKIVIKDNTDSAEIAVTQKGKKGKFVAVDHISISPAELVMKKGDYVTVTAYVLPDNASEKELTWSSSDTTVATVSYQGIVTAKAIGNATITATTLDKTKTATCTVIVREKVTSVSLNYTSLTMTEGETKSLIATVLPDNAANKSVSWSSSNTSVATVAKPGIVTAVSAGTATITVTTNDGGKTATCSVTVKPKTIPVTSISLNYTALTLNEGNTQALTATVLPANATDKSVTWSSSNSSAATVSSSGVVTAKAKGTATITVKTNDGGKTASCTVNVVRTSYEYVDLGLPSGLKWATCNIGASKPEEYGDYYAWGETETKADYSWTNYKWSNGFVFTPQGAIYNLTKYCYEEQFGTRDDKKVLEEADDVAHVKLGGKWRIPTPDDWGELRDNCTCNWIVQAGIRGMKVTGKNGTCIFLPAAGRLYNTISASVGSSGYYWSSHIDISSSPYSFVLHFTDSFPDVTYPWTRSDGLPVRPVSE